MGLAILVLGLAVFLAPHTLTALRAARQQVVNRVGIGPYKAIYSLVSLIGLVLIGYGFGALSRDRLDRRLVSAELDAPRHRRADVAGHHLHRRRLHPRRHQARAQASDAGRREAVGGRASDRQRRSRLDHPVRRRSWPGRCSTASRSSVAADPGAPPIPVGGGATTSSPIVVGTVLYLVLGLCVPSLCDRRPRLRQPA